MQGKVKRLCVRVSKSGFVSVRDIDKMKVYRYFHRELENFCGAVVELLYQDNVNKAEIRHQGIYVCTANLIEE